MSQETWAIVGVIVTIAAVAAAWFFIGPKEAGQLMSQRLTALELAHQSLALRFESSHARHDESLENLTHSIDRLTKQIERLEGHIIGKPRGRG